jgi:hypothetical protein
MDWVKQKSHLRPVRPKNASDVRSNTPNADLAAMATIAQRTDPALARLAALGHIQHSYNPRWSCPIPPKENRLKVAIRAGEKVFEGAGHD